MNKPLPNSHYAVEPMFRPSVKLAPYEYRTFKASLEAHCLRDYYITQEETLMSLSKLDTALSKDRRTRTRYGLFVSNRNNTLPENRFEFPIRFIDMMVRDDSRSLTDMRKLIRDHNIQIWIGSARKPERLSHRSSPRIWENDWMVFNNLKFTFGG